MLSQCRRTWVVSPNLSARAPMLNVSCSPLDFMPTLSRSLVLMTKEEDEKAAAAPQLTDDLIALLDAADRLPGVVELRKFSYELLGATPGKTVVDVGCGAGRAVAELDERGIKAVGVDPDTRMIAVARGRWTGA